MVLIEIIEAFGVFQIHPFLIHIDQGTEINFTLADHLRLLELLLFHLELDFTDRGETLAAGWLAVADLSPGINWLLVCNFAEGYSALLLLDWLVFDVVVLLNVRVKSILDLVLWSAW